MFKHSCIKCQTPYEDSDEDAYLCPVCLEERKRIAAEVDRKMAGHVSQRATKTDLQIAMERGQTVPSKNPYGGQSTFVKAADLGINLSGL